MACLLSTIATWSAPVYYGLFGFTNSIIFPSYVKADPQIIKTEETALKVKNLKLIVDVAKRVGGLRKDIGVYCSRLSKNIDVEGTNFSLELMPGTNIKSEAMLIYNPNTESLDQDVFKFMLMRALFHIKFNDEIKVYSLAVISSTITAYATSHIQSYIPCWMGMFLCIFPHACGKMAYQSFKKYALKRAYNFALTISTIDELRAIEKYYRKMIETTIEIASLSTENTGFREKSK